MTTDGTRVRFVSSPSRRRVARVHLTNPIPLARTLARMRLLDTVSSTRSTRRRGHESSSMPALAPSPRLSTPGIRIPGSVFLRFPPARVSPRRGIVRVVRGVRVHDRVARELLCFGEGVLGFEVDDAQADVHLDPCSSSSLPTFSMSNSSGGRPRIASSRSRLAACICGRNVWSLERRALGGGGGAKSGFRAPAVDADCCFFPRRRLGGTGGASSAACSTARSARLRPLEPSPVAAAHRGARLPTRRRDRNYPHHRPNRGYLGITNRRNRRSVLGSSASVMKFFSGSTT